MSEPAMNPRTDVLRIALTQSRVTADMSANVATATALIEQAGAAGADLVLLPENALLLGSNTQMRDRALSVEAPEIDQLRAAAKSAACTVILGGFKRRDEHSEIYNTALVIAATGEIAGHYNKIHLFDAVVGGRSFEASSVERRGDTPVLLQIGDARVGLTICYDVRFPELYRNLALAGAHVLLVPAAFTAKTGDAHWEVLLRARAIENGAYVVASATVRGAEEDDAIFPTYGHALAVDPWGRILADLGEQEQALHVVEVDVGQANKVRRELPVLRGVRPPAYATEPTVVEVALAQRQEAT